MRRYGVLVYAQVMSAVVFLAVVTLPSHAYGDGSGAPRAARVPGHTWSLGPLGAVVDGDPAIGAAVSYRAQVERPWVWGGDVDWLFSQERTTRGGARGTETDHLISAAVAVERELSSFLFPASTGDRDGVGAEADDASGGGSDREGTDRDGVGAEADDASGGGTDREGTDREGPDRDRPRQGPFHAANHSVYGGFRAGASVEFDRYEAPGDVVERDVEVYPTAGAFLSAVWRLGPTVGVETRATVDFGGVSRVGLAVALRLK